MPCHSGWVTDEQSPTSPTSATAWLTVPEIAAMIGGSPSRVRRLIDDHHLVATKRDGVLSVPELFFVDGQPLPSLRGTIIVLLDAGFTADEAVEWLLEADDTIGVPPIEALRAGRKSEVRRVAQTLA